MPETILINPNMEICKSATNVEKGLVFGWFSIIEKDGKSVVDKQGDVIDSETLENAAYDFVLNARVSGEMHVNKNVGQLIESMYFSKEKQDALGIDLKKIGWWGGFQINDPEVKKKIKKGIYPSFSIEGIGTREEIK